LGARVSERLKTINARKAAEVEQLAEIFENIAENRRKIAGNLIARAAHMHVAMEDMEARMDKDGQLKNMQQGNYKIKVAHPLFEKYNTMDKNYNATLKMLIDLLPQQTGINTEAGKRMLDYLTKGQVE